MTQTEPHEETSRENCKAARRTFCFVWMILGLLLLVLAGAATLVKCPWLFPAAHPQMVAGNAGLEQRVAALEKQVAALGVPAAPQSAAAGTDTKNLQAQVETLQKQNDDTQKAARKLVAAALAFWELQDAAKKGQNFAQPLATLRAVAGDDAAVAQQMDRLEPYAGNPPPSLPQLRDNLVKQEAKISEPPGHDANASWLERAKALLQPLISIHPLHNPQFAALESALEAGDAPAALTALQNLPDDIQSKLESLHSGLQAHKDIDDSLESIRKILEGAA